MTKKNPVISLITGFCYISKPRIRCGVMSPRPLVRSVAHCQMRVLREAYLCGFNEKRHKRNRNKQRRKPSKIGLSALLVAPPARLELTTFRLGGGPSILVRYGGIYETLAFCEQADSRFFQKTMAETYLRRGSIRLSY